MWSKIRAIIAADVQTTSHVWINLKGLQRTKSDIFLALVFSENNEHVVVMPSAKQIDKKKFQPSKFNVVVKWSVKYSPLTSFWSWLFGQDRNSQE